MLHDLLTDAWNRNHDLAAAKDWRGRALAIQRRDDGTETTIFYLFSFSLSHPIVFLPSYSLLRAATMAEWSEGEALFFFLLSLLVLFCVFPHSPCKPALLTSLWILFLPLRLSVGDSGRLGEWDNTSRGLICAVGWEYLFVCLVLSFSVYMLDCIFYFACEMRMGNSWPDGGFLCRFCRVVEE